MVHVDWDEIREYLPSYIKNKPLLLTSGGATQQAADWEATGGPTQIVNKPIIPATQVSSDWNSTVGISQILNKPVKTPAQVQSNSNATSSHAQILNQPPVVVQSDWNANSGLAAILNKPTIPDSQSPVDWGAFSGYTRIINKPNIQGGSFSLTDGKAQISFGTSFKNPPAVVVTLAESTDNADVYSFNVTEATTQLFTMSAHCSGPSTSNTVLPASGETFSWILLGCDNAFAFRYSDYI